MTHQLTEIVSSNRRDAHIEFELMCATDDLMSELYEFARQSQSSRHMSLVNNLTHDYMDTIAEMLKGHFVTPDAFLADCEKLIDEFKKHNDAELTLSMHTSITKLKDVLEQQVSNISKNE